MKILKNCYPHLTSAKNIWSAWRIFRRGKRHRADVRNFEEYLEENLIAIRNDLLAEKYVHGSYYSYLVHDPKQRLISVASVRDRVVHQAVCNVVIPFYERIWLPQSFSCRTGKGLLAAIKTLQKNIRAQSGNGNYPCWILHGDVKKCFDSIVHDKLIGLLEQRIHCESTMELVKKIVNSYSSHEPNRGLPLGNVTSQWLVNAYLHELDVYAIKKLGERKYVRYSDDFLIVTNTRMSCFDTSEKIRKYLFSNLELKYPADHERVVNISGGLEALGRFFKPGYSCIKSRSVHRIHKRFNIVCRDFASDRLSGDSLEAVWQSYRGLLQIGCNYIFLNALSTAALLVGLPASKTLK